MNTKITVGLICIIGALIPLSAWLKRTGSGDSIFWDSISSLAVLVLLFYGLFRGQTSDHKSSRVPPKIAAVILCGIGLWTIFCFYRALAR
jgi:hypothetical protein